MNFKYRGMVLDVSSETQHLNWEVCYKELGFTRHSEGFSSMSFEGFLVSVCIILVSVQPNLRAATLLTTNH